MSWREDATGGKERRGRRKETGEVRGRRGSPGEECGKLARKAMAVFLGAKWLLMKGGRGTSHSDTLRCERIFGGGGKEGGVAYSSIPRSGFQSASPRASLLNTKTRTRHTHSAPQRLGNRIRAQRTPAQRGRGRGMGRGRFAGTTRAASQKKKTVGAGRRAWTSTDASTGGEGGDEGEGARATVGRVFYFDAAATRF